MILLMSASQFITQRQLMTKNMDLTVKTPFMQQQKMLMYVFPVMFAVMGINFPVGVLVYWLTTNIWSMGQQLIVIRNNPTPGSKAWDERQDRLKKAGRINPDGTVIKGRFFGLLPAGAAAKTASAESVVEDSVQVRRQQPRKLTKAQRAQGAAVSTATTSLTKDEAAKDEQPAEPADAVPAESGTAGKSGAAKPAAAKQAAAKQGTTRPGTRQQPKRGGQQGGQRPKKKS
jgi:YidC/Oxa1 family membrane protein insertase